MTDTGDDESVLNHVQPYEWSDEQAIDFEVAQDTISLFIAACTDRYWTERRKDSPDAAVMEYWEEERRKASQASHALRADDPAAIRATLLAFGQRIRDLKGGVDG